MDENINLELAAPEEEDDELLPDGWADGDDIFDEGSWAGETAAADGPAAPAEQEPGTPTGEPAEEPPTIEAPAPVNAELKSGAAPTPTTEPVHDPAPKRLKFRAKVDHDDVDVDLDEAELPTIYQKAQVTERAQAKLERLNPLLGKLSQLTRAMGYDSDAAMLEGAIENLRTSKIEELTSSGTPEEIAKDYVERLFGAPAQISHTKEELQTPAPTTTPADRDFKNEVEELLRERPQMRGKALPDEVIQAAVKGNKRLLSAYNDWSAKQTATEIESLRKENNTLKQNAASAARAPVKGVAKGGATDPSPDDPFLKGFDSDTW